MSTSPDEDAKSSHAYSEKRNKETVETEEKIKELFNEMDKDHSNDLTKKEVRELAKKMGDKLTTLFSHKKLDEAFAEMDPNNDGRVTLEEFINWHHRTHPTEPRHVYEQADFLFKQMDKDKSGKLDKDEIRELLNLTGNKISGMFGIKKSYGSEHKTFDEILRELDTDDDGYVTRFEFLKWHCKQHEIDPPKELGFKRYENEVKEKKLKKDELRENTISLPPEDGKETVLSTTDQSKYKIGDQVIVLKGPISGSTGFLEEYMEDENKWRIQFGSGENRLLKPSRFAILKIDESKEEFIPQIIQQKSKKANKKHLQQEKRKPKQLPHAKPLHECQSYRH